MKLRVTFKTNDGDPKTSHNPDHLKITKREAGVKGKNLTDKLNNRKGIYIMVSDDPMWAYGHADLLKADGTYGVECHFDGPIKWIDTWELK